MLEIKSVKEFDQIIGTEQSLILVVFTAAWFSANQICRKIVEQAENENRGRFLAYKIDAEKNPEFQEKLGIRGIPTTLFYCDGAELERLSGSYPQSVFESALARNLPTNSNQSASGQRNLSTQKETP